MSNTTTAVAIERKSRSSRHVPTWLMATGLATALGIGGWAHQKIWDLHAEAQVARNERVHLKEAIIKLEGAMQRVADATNESSEVSREILRALKAR